MPPPVHRVGSRTSSQTNRAPGLEDVKPVVGDRSNLSVARLQARTEEKLFENLFLERLDHLPTTRQGEKAAEREEKAHAM